MSVFRETSKISFIFVRFMRDFISYEKFFLSVFLSPDFRAINFIFFFLISYGWRDSMIPVGIYERKKKL